MARKPNGRAISGWIVIDKPAGLTSTQVVGRVRRVLQPRKLGHGGTLDPLATGLLPIALGEATKTVAYVMDAPKTYVFTLRWGAATTTDDADGEVVETCPERPAPDAIRAILPRFVGAITQVPPAFSAIKVQGRRAYEMARRAQDFELAPRTVRIDDITLEACDGEDHATFRVTCGKGAYMRALARDLGTALGTCAHIVALRRTAVGGFAEDHAISLESLEALGHSPAALEAVLPLETALDDIPALALTEIEANRLRSGQAVSMVARANRDRIRDFVNGAIVFATMGGKPIALARYEAGDIRPVRVLNI